ncbi:MAG: hypothetical protein M3N17_05035, partial [Actinomycetota bacterium]|nr:hypothetical protein [Actinomycetota bacterium]
MDEPMSTTRTLVDACRRLVDGAVARLAADSASDGRVDLGLVDREQPLAYDLATTASQVAAAEEMVSYGEQGPFEARLALAFAGEVAAELGARMLGREAAWGLRGDGP